MIYRETILIFLKKCSLCTLTENQVLVIKSGGLEKKKHSVLLTGEHKYGFKGKAVGLCPQSSASLPVLATSLPGRF